MKKLKLIATMLLAVITSGAQEKRIIDRDLTFNGPLTTLSRAENPSDENAIFFDEGYEWYLQNKRIGKNNYVSFWIQAPDGSKKEFNSWKDHDVSILVKKTEDNKIIYAVFDDTYLYLTILKYGSIYYAHLYTSER